MRIHVSSSVDYRTLVHAADHASAVSGAPVWYEHTWHGSRTADYAAEITLSSDGTLNKRHRNPGTSRDRSALSDYAATWDQWGHFLAYLYSVDPGMVVGGSRKTPWVTQSSLPRSCLEPASTGNATGPHTNTPCPTDPSPGRERIRSRVRCRDRPRFHRHRHRHRHNRETGHRS